MSRGIIGIDCDLTLCAIDDLWVKWLQTITQTHNSTKLHTALVYTGKLKYNLASYWQEELDELGIDGLDFFRGTSIYDFAEPVAGAVDVVAKLKKLGYEIVVISALKGHHHKSKYNWVQRNFYVDGFIATKEKQYIPCDIFIDDRNNFLNIANATHKIKLNTVYEQDVPLTTEAITCNNWAEVYNQIINTMERRM